MLMKQIVHIGLGFWAQNSVESKSKIIEGSFYFSQLMSNLQVYEFVA